MTAPPTRSRLLARVAAGWLAAAALGGCTVEGSLRAHPGADPSPDGLPDAASTVPVPPRAPPPAADTADVAAPPVTPPRPPAPPDPCPLLPDPIALASCGPSIAAVADGAPFGSLAEAVAAARGPEVVVCPGAWPAGVVVPDGLGLVAADPTSGATTLVGPPGAPVVSAAGDVTLRGLTVRGGRADHGAGLTAAGDVTLTCTSFEDDVAGAGDGGAVFTPGAIVAEWSTFRDDAAAGRGGALAGGTLLLHDCTFEGDDALDGGAVWSAGAVTLERATFLANTAGTGGALSLGSWSPARVTVTDAAFHENLAARGGAVWSRPWAPSSLVFERAAWDGNGASDGAGALELAGDDGVELSLTDVAFDANEGRDVGGIGLSGWLGPGVRIAVDVARFDDNAGGAAGGLWASSLAGPVRVAAAELQMWRNVGADGAASLRAGDTFRCVGCDFGAGENDNVPTDATFGDAAQGALPAAF